MTLKDRVQAESEHYRRVSILYRERGDKENEEKARYVAEVLLQILRKHEDES